jgi:hypothetical protein
LKEKSIEKESKIERNDEIKKGTKNMEKREKKV